jgi:hypothetical protein
MNLISIDSTGAAAALVDSVDRWPDELVLWWLWFGVRGGGI